jgi:RES domain-containing protein
MRRRIQRYRSVFETLGQPARGSFVRAVPLKYQDFPLSGVGSIITGGRYNAKGAFEILYFANDGDTMLREVRIVQYDTDGTAITVLTAPYILLSLTYSVSHAVDLTDRTIQERLKITDADLDCAWELAVLNGQAPITQDLGYAAREAGIEAIVVPSSRHPGHSNICVISDQLLETSFVRIHNADGIPTGVVTELHGMKTTRTP